MARPLRLEAPGEFFHVLTRGNERRPIYLDDRDREAFLALLAEVVERFGVACHAYCLMGNHYHLLVQPVRGDLPRALRHLNGVYAQRFNRRHGRSGHLFEGRYKCLLVDRDAHLLELARYIVLNPVRAGLVASPGAWRWSSFRATAGSCAPPMFLSTRFLREALADDGGEAGAEAYREFVALGGTVGGDDARIRTLIEGSAIAGGRPFVAQFEAELRAARAHPEISAAQAAATRPRLADLLDAASSRTDRDLRIGRAVLEHGYSQAAVAAHLGLGRNTVSRVIRGARMVQWET